MADDSDPKKGQDGSLDPFAGVGDDDWADAIDDWDAGLALPTDPAPAVETLPDDVGPAVIREPSGIDPLVDLVDGEMDVNPEDGQALGALLGAAGDEPASDEPASDETVADPRSSSPRQAASAHPGGLAREATTEIAELVDGLAGDTSPASGALASDPAQAETPARGGRRRRLSQAVAKVALRKAPAAGRSGAVEERVRPRADKRAEDLFDDLVRLDEEAIAIEAPIEAGQVLPEARGAAEMPMRGPGKLVGVEEEDHTPQPMSAPPLPERLLSLPLDPTIPDRAAPLTRDASDWAPFAEAIDAQIQGAQSTKAAAELELLAAQAAEASGETDQALDRYREVLVHRPGHLPALCALWRLHNQRREADQVVEAIRGIAEPLDKAQKRDLMLAAADLLWSCALDDEGAKALCDEAAALTPTPMPLRGVWVAAALDLASRDLDRVCEALQVLADRVGDPATEACLKIQLGRGHESQGRLRQAAATYAQASHAAPTATGAWEGLIRCGERLDDFTMVADGLAGSAPLLGGWGSHRRRSLGVVATLRKIESIEPLQEYRRAVEGGGGRLALAELADALRDAAQPVAAAESYRELAEISRHDPHRQAALLVEAARCIEEGSESSDQALALYRQAIDIAPDHTIAAAAIARLEIHNPDAARRFEAHRATAALEEGARAAVHYLAAAEILDHELDRKDDAIEAYLAALKHDPARPVALGRLEELCRASGKLSTLAEALERVATGAQDDERSLDFRLDAAAVYARDAQPERAFERYAEVLDRDGDRCAARWGSLKILAVGEQRKKWVDTLIAEAKRTEGALAAAFWLRAGQGLAAEDGDEALRCFDAAIEQDADCVAAADAAIEVHAASGAWRQVAEGWQRMAERLPQPSAQRAALELRAATVYEVELDDPARAAELYATANDAPSSAPGALVGLLRVHRQTGDTEQLAQELERELSASSDPGDRFAILLASAELARRSGVDGQQVEARFRRALREMPGHPMGEAGLADLYLELEEWEKAARLCSTELIKEDLSDAQRLVCYDRLIEIDLARDDLESAAANVDAFSDLAPDAVSVRRFRQHRALQQGDTEALIGELQLEVSAGSGSLDSAALALDLARRLNRQRYGDVGADGQTQQVEAIQRTLDGALEADPQTTLALHLLADLAWATENAQALAEVYQRMSLVTESPSEQAILIARAAEARQEDLDGYRQALERARDCLPVIYRLRDAALRAEAWEDAANASEAEIAASRVTSHVLEARRLAGSIAREKLQDVDRAISHFSAILEIAPADRHAFAQIRALFEQDERWSELYDALAARAEIEPSATGRAALYRQMAKVAHDHLDDETKARESLSALLDLDDEDLAALALLAELAERNEEWQEAASALIRWARLEDDPAVSRELFSRLGVIYHEHLPNMQRAIASFRKVTKFDPKNHDALQRLSDLYLEDLDFEKAHDVTTELYELESDPDRRVDHLLRIAKIQEDGLKDPHQASLAFRKAIELAPADLKAIGALCGFYARQGDQRSMMVHLDRSVATMRGRLRDDPFESFAYHALFKIFGWRKAPDGCMIAAQLLEALGIGDKEERAFIEGHATAVGKGGSELGSSDHDDRMFQRAIPGGFRQIFQLLSPAFAKIRRGDIRGHGLSRGDRVSNSDHPVRRLGDALAAEFGVGAYQLYLVDKDNADALIVENTDPPAILLGKSLLRDATEDELRFLMGRCLWIIAKAMILPTRLRPEDLELLVAGVVRQYVPDFSPPDADAHQLGEVTRQVAKVVPRKLRQELMPFALECSGTTVDLKALGGAVIHSANRAGLLACRSIEAALNAMCRAAGMSQRPSALKDATSLAQSSPEIEELLRFAVSDEHFELRRAMGIAIR